MRRLVVYYSFEGNTKFVAEEIAKAVGADLLALQPKKEIKTHGFFKYFWGGRQVMMRETPELLPLEKDPADYDLIFIGTPVWAFSFAPPLRTFFNAVKLINKKVALFATYEGHLGKTFENMREPLSGNGVIGEKEFLNVNDNKEKTRMDLQAWLEIMRIEIV